MLLFQTILLASLSSATPMAPAVKAAKAVQATKATTPAEPTAPATKRGSAPSWFTRLFSLRTTWKRLQLSVPCASLSGGTAPCVSLVPDHGSLEPTPAAGTYSGLGWKMPRRNDAFRTQGGFVHLDMVSSPALRVGPELSWSTPDSPREDMPKMRLLSPGMGLRVAWGASPVAVGVSACSRVLMIGRDLPMVDPLTSEARVEFQLP